jgi:signal transduction histidine kinase
MKLPSRVFAVFFAIFSIPLFAESPAENLANSWIGLKGALLDESRVLPPSHIADIRNPLSAEKSLRDFRDAADAYRRSEFFSVSVSRDPSVQDSMRDILVMMTELQSVLERGGSSDVFIPLVLRIDTRMLQLTASNYAFAKSVNRSYMAIMYIFLAMVLVILFALLFFRARIRKAQQHEASSAEYAHSVIRAHEEERRKLARELHDTVVQDITGIKLKTEALGYEIARNGKKYTAEFDGLVLEERRCIERIRRVCYDLRPPELDYLDLRASLAELCDQFGGWTGIGYTLECPEGLILSDREKINAYRIVQELLSNVRKHSYATRARVEVSRSHDDSVRIVVQDNGLGIDVNLVRNIREIRNRHFGLRGIRERVDILGGSMNVSRLHEGGTEVRIEFPLTDAVPRGSIPDIVSPASEKRSST